MASTIETPLVQGRHSDLQIKENGDRRGILYGTPGAGVPTQVQVLKKKANERQGQESFSELASFPKVLTHLSFDAFQWPCKASGFLSSIVQGRLE